MAGVTTITVIIEQDRKLVSEGTLCWIMSVVVQVFAVAEGFEADMLHSVGYLAEALLWYFLG